MTDITLDVKITSLAEIMDRLLNNNMEEPDWVFALIVVPTTHTMIGGTAAIMSNVPNTDVQHILGNALRSLSEATDAVESHEVTDTPRKPS